MEHYRLHGSATITSRLFSISRSVIYDWKKHQESTGTLKAKEGYQNGYGHRIKDLESFKCCVEKNSGESYPYAWSKKGERAFALKSGKYRARINFMGALHGQQFMAPFMFYGYCDSLVFETYLEKILLPELLPGKIIIVDNAAFHKSARAKALVHMKGCQLIFLPAYSPDLNPIEHCWFPSWFPIKNKVRQRLDQGEPVDDAIFNTLQQSSESIW